ncbi:MAG: hypothetical protein ACI83D_000446, partial [Planctomycetota bacterium]
KQLLLNRLGIEEDIGDVYGVTNIEGGFFVEFEFSNGFLKKISYADVYSH